MRKGKNKLTLTTAFRNGSSEKKELLTKSVLSALVVGTAFTAALGVTSTVSAVEPEHKVADVNNRIAMYMTDSDDVDATATTTDAIAIGNGAAAITYGTIAIGANTGGISEDNKEKQASTATNAIYIGHEAGKSTSGESVVAIGSNAGDNMSGESVVAIGPTAGGSAAGAAGADGADEMIAIGLQAGYTQQGAKRTYISVEIPVMSRRVQEIST